MKTYFDSVYSVIKALNDNKAVYLILRNFENLLNEEIYVGGHEDIDILCQSSDEIIVILGAISNRPKEDKTHYHIFINNNRVNLDLRSVGDGYYCTRWQEDMLHNRKVNCGFYVMNEIDYFYSLIYHAIIQKRIFTEEYRQRLTDMSKKMGLHQNEYTKEEFIKELEKFMKFNSYTFDYTRDPSIPLQFSLVSNSLIRFHMLRFVKRKLFIIKRMLAKIKNTI